MSPKPAALPYAPPSGARRADPGGAGAPERIGVYRITGLLGEGGMGAVYRGERSDGLFEQTVAIKLMRPGVLSRAAAELFSTERRILARLQHAHIAQLLDGGVAEGGVSYIVMEYLDGAPITRYATEKVLPRHERIALFRTACVCRAACSPEPRGARGYQAFQHHGDARRAREAAGLRHRATDGRIGRRHAGEPRAAAVLTHLREP